MSAAVQGQFATPRNPTIAKGEADNREKSVDWTSHASSSLTPVAAQAVTKTGNEASVTPNRLNGMINKDDLINSNPAATASSGGAASSNNVHEAGTTGSGRMTATREQSSESAGNANLTDDGSSGKTSGVDGKKQVRRRKANRACSHCQKAHLTCDDSRPCERCVKKGLADSCTDGARKKAKYLLDEDEILELKREKERKKSEGQSSMEPTTIKTEAMEQSDRLPQPSDWAPKLDLAHLSPSHQVSFGDATTIAPASLSESAQSLTAVKEGTGTPSAHPNSETDLYTTISSFSPTSSSGLNHTFGSETTSLEYSILSSMLNGIDPAWLSGSPDGQGAETDLGRVLGADSGPADPFTHMGIDGMPWQLAQEESSPWRDSSREKASLSQVEPLHHMGSTISSGTNPTDGLAAYDALEVPSPQGTATSALDLNGRSAPLTGQPESSAGAGARLAQSVQSSRRAAAAAAAAAGQDKKPDAAWRDRVKHIYSDKMKPFPYTEGYHFLIKYVTANLEKAQVLRIVRALAIFRPSLIALQMPLSEEDEVFVERSIQRTILEFEKLISFSGTPTVVWRRTCEVVVVGAEFSMLTQWSKEYLSGRYIYELFDKPSILDYWEKFALHAFENTTQSIMMQVTLKTSTGNTIKCAACFSIKRDVFDLPSLIVGNFLPILN